MAQVIRAGAGETLMEAMRREGRKLNAPCGGNHSCGKCRIRILRGEASPVMPEERRFLSGEELESGWRLACSVYGSGEWLVEMPEQDANARVVTGGADDPVETDPASRVRRVSIEPPSLSDQRSDAERAAAGGRFEWAALKKLPGVMRAGDAIYLAAFDDGSGERITDCSKEEMANLGIAVDVGTTTMAAYLIDLSDGRQLACASEMNPQRSFGGDVISRVDYATSSAEAQNRLQSLVTEAIERMGRRMLRECGRSAGDVRHIVCVGNTIMMHLLAGLETKNIARTPFVPVYTGSWSVRAEQMMSGFENAYLTLGPCVAGYVGADTVAAALVCQMGESEEMRLLIDIGTNGEIALGNRDGIVCCSAAAGPAFEGAHIRCGSGAQDGAIDHVKMSDGNVIISTLGGGKPTSICGSGLVDAVAQMLLAGVIDETGRMDEDEAPDEYLKYFFEFEGKPAFSLDGEMEKGVFICQQDVREVQLAKASIAAGVRVLLNEANVGFDAIRELCLAGGFGNYISHESAVAIGLLPSELSERICSVGNAAGSGAKQMLKNRDRARQSDELRKKMRYVELSACTEFQDLFVESMMFGEDEC